MSKIALITDSTSDLSKEEIKNNNIHILPLRIIYKDREYIDRIDITPDEVYSNLSKEIPSTSLPSMEDIDKMFIKLEKEGYTHAILTCISSGISGTFNSINIVSQNHPNIISHVFDSRSLTVGTGAIVLECAKMIDVGNDYEEIVAKLPSIRDRIKVYYVVDTLNYLIKGGRIGKVSGTIGELFKIKPIISINEEGIYYTYEKVRGRNQSISKLIDIARVLLESSRSKVWVLQGGAMVEGKALYESILKLPNLIEADFRDISPVMGVHTGPGLLGIVIMSEE